MFSMCKMFPAVLTVIDKHHCNFYAEVSNHILLVYFKDDIDTGIVFYLAHTLLKSRLFVMSRGDTAKKEKKRM